MNFNPVSDLSQSLQSRRYNAEVKSDLVRLSQELASGQKSDIAKAVGGDFRALAGIENSLRALDSFKLITTEAEQYAGTMQRTLGLVQTMSEDMWATLSTSDDLNSDAATQAVSQDAKGKLQSVISAINTPSSVGTVFSGATTNGPALASADVILDELRAVVASETTAAGVKAAIDNWFDASGGGFETQGYLGSTTSKSGFKVGSSEVINLDIKADEPEIRDVLKGLSLAALAGDGLTLTPPDNSRDLFDMARGELGAANNGLVKLRSDVGRVEAGIENASVRNEAEKTALEMSLNHLTSIDPFETATRLQETQTQLETLYTVTARLSQLTLVDFLR
ncbi:flagellin [Pseudaestuariivita rosea]|uniref:flagellin n=1 Tax=Pseudaestuariivita rosea TaxID=2763263 RepID=UPI001ABAC22C|nr:flagellin [Pseudaestuariivita rosea]